MGQEDESECEAGQADRESQPSDEQDGQTHFKGVAISGMSTLGKRPIDTVNGYLETVRQEA